MSWERRGNNYYYYYKFKSSGQVKSIYGGSGRRGAFLATLPTEWQADQDSLRERSRAVNEAERRLIQSIEQRLIDYYNEVEACFLWWMEAAGYYLHRRQWRRKGRITMANRDQITLPPSIGEIESAIRADKARREFEDSPNPDALIDFYKGDPSKICFEILISQLSFHEHQKEALRRQAQKRREELAGPDPTPIERTLADQAVVCEFDLSYCQICISEADILGHRATATLYDRRRQRAHKRLMSALKTLATVRRLALPHIQSTATGNMRIYRAC